MYTQLLHWSGVRKIFTCHFIGIVFVKLPFLALRLLDASSRTLRCDAMRCDLLPPELFAVSDISNSIFSYFLS